jgi:hypothetical protein
MGCDTLRASSRRVLWIASCSGAEMNRMALFLSLFILPACGTSAGSSSALTDAGRPSSMDGGPNEDGMADANLAETSVSVTGQIAGKAFEARGAATKRFLTDSMRSDAGSQVFEGGLAFAIGQYPSMCTSPYVELSAGLRFTVRSAEQVVGPGVYPIMDSNVSGGTGVPPQATLDVLQVFNEGCSISIPESATSGTLTLTRSSGGFLEGSFVATLKKSGAVQGTFRIRECESGTVDETTVLCAL